MSRRVGVIADGQMEGGEERMKGDGGHRMEGRREGRRCRGLEWRRRGRKKGCREEKEHWKNEKRDARSGRVRHKHAKETKRTPPPPHASATLFPSLFVSPTHVFMHHQEEKNPLLPLIVQSHRRGTDGGQ